MDAAKIVAAINALLGLIPVVGSFYTQLVAYREQMSAVAAAGGTVTAAQWEAIDADVQSKLAQLNAP